MSIHVALISDYGSGIWHVYEIKFKDIIDKLKMVGESGLAIYEIDKELGSLPNETAEI